MSRRHKENDDHHRKPRSRDGTNDPRNISKVPRNKHEAWHLLFANHTPTMIVDIINEFWLDPDFHMVAIPRLERR